MTGRPSLVRRSLGALAASGFALAVVVSTASAETREITSGHFEGSRLTTPPKVAIPNESIAAYIKRESTIVPLGDVTVTMGRAPGIPAACTVAVGEPDRGSSTSEGTPVWANTLVNCNGAYPYTLDAEDRPPLAAPRTMSLDSTLIVEVPPTAVGGVVASVPEGSRNVTISWKASSNPSPDFLGYRVERRLGSGQWVAVASVAKSATSILDDGLPADPGEYSYRVRGRRAGAGDNEVLSSEGSIDKVTLSAGDPTSSTSTSVGGTDGGTTPNTPGGGGAPGDPTTPSTTRDGKVIPSIINTGKGRGRANGTPAPGLGSSTQNGLGVLLTPVPGEFADEDGDGSYDEELPFGDPSIDESLADGEDGSSLFYEGTGGRGMAIPVAVGFVFFAWAIHLRFLARAARPEAGQVAYAETWDPFDPFYEPMS